jgi:hypothetical protein
MLHAYAFAIPVEITKTVLAGLSSLVQAICAEPPDKPGDDE